MPPRRTAIRLLRRSPACSSPSGRWPRLARRGGGDERSHLPPDDRRTPAPMPVAACRRRAPFPRLRRRRPDVYTKATVPEDARGERALPRREAAGGHRWLSSAPVRGLRRARDPEGRASSASPSSTAGRTPPRAKGPQGCSPRARGSPAGDHRARGRRSTKRTTSRGSESRSDTGKPRGDPGRRSSRAREEIMAPRSSARAASLDVKDQCARVFSRISGGSPDVDFVTPRSFHPLRGAPSVGRGSGGDEGQARGSAARSWRRRGRASRSAESPPQERNDLVQAEEFCRKAIAGGRQAEADYHALLGVSSMSMKPERQNEAATQAPASLISRPPSRVNKMCERGPTSIAACS